MDEAQDILGTAANTTANATGTAMEEAKDILSTAGNATANATGELMTQTENCTQFDFRCCI